MPSRAVARTSLISTAALGLALLAGSPALADDSAPVYTVGAPCPADLTVLVGTGFTCDSNGLIAAVPPATTDPAPTETPAPTDPPTSDPTPTTPPVVDPTAPVSVPISAGGGDTPTTGSDAGNSGSGTTGSGTSGGSGTSTTGGTSATGSSTTDSSAKSGTTLEAAAASAGTASKTSLLSAATAANLAGSGDLPSLAALQSLPVTPTLSGGLPLSAYTPSPLVADLPAATALSSVQAPLLAVGNDAASGSGFTLAGLSSRALPGLLVVLATALVAAVGAGNLRYWQDRLGTRR